MSKKNKNINISFDFAGLLFITFLVLKLTKVIDWSWWWVTAPLWIPFAILGAVAVIAIIFLIIVGLWALIMESIVDKKKY